MVNILVQGLLNERKNGEKDYTIELEAELIMVSVGFFGAVYCPNSGILHIETFFGQFTARTKLLDEKLLLPQNSLCPKNPKGFFCVQPETFLLFFFSIKSTYRVKAKRNMSSIKKGDIGEGLFDGSTINITWNTGKKLTIQWPPDKSFQKHFKLTAMTDDNIF